MKYKEGVGWLIWLTLKMGVGVCDGMEWEEEERQT